MILKLKKLIYHINNQNDEIDFNEKNTIIAGANNFGKTFIISLILLLLGSRSAKEKMLELLSKSNSIDAKIEYTINGADGYKSDSKEHKINAEIKFDNNRKNFIYYLRIDGSEKKIKGTRDYANEIFKIIGFPNRIVWTKSLASLFMDDVLRFTVMEQDYINYATRYSTILKINKAPKVRVVLALLWILNKNSPLIKEIIDNEHLFRKKLLSNKISELNSAVKNNTLLYNGREIKRSKNILDQYKEINDRIIIFQKEARDVNTKISHLKYIRGDEGPIEEMFEATFNKWLETVQETEIKAWIEDQKQAIMIKNDLNIDEKIRNLEKEFNNKKEKIKKLKELISNLFKDLDNSSKAYLLNEFINSNPILKEADEEDIEIDKIKNIYEGNYSNIIRKVENFFDFEDATLNWEKKGGASQVILNTKRIIKFANIISKEREIKIPLIIDGIIAENFSDKNMDGEWVEELHKTNLQTIIAIARPNSEESINSDKKIEKLAEKIISKSKDKSNFTMKNIKKITIYK